MGMECYRKILCTDTEPLPLFKPLHKSIYFIYEAFRLTVSSITKHRSYSPTQYIEKETDAVNWETFAL